MNGWIIHKKQLGENHEVQRLVEEFEKRDVKVRVVNPKDVDIIVDRDDRKSIIVEGVPRKLPDFVLPRTGSGTTYFIKAIIRHLERLGVTLINGSDAIDNVITWFCKFCHFHHLSKLFFIINHKDTTTITTT